MNWQDIDNTYLVGAIERISGALEEISGIPVMVDPPQDFLEKATDSLWIVGAVLMAGSDKSADDTTQTWSVASYLMWKPKQTNYDETIYSFMYELGPKTINYMQAHKRLQFKDDDAPLNYLIAGNVSVTIQNINPQGQAGLTIIHRLPFKLVIEQEY